MNHSSIRCVLAASLCLLTVPLLFAQDDSKADADGKKQTTKADAKSDKGSSDASTTYTVRTEPLKVEVQLVGTFEASDTSEIAVRTDVWAELTIAAAARHGQRVGVGAILLRCDTKKIDAAIKDLEADLAASQLALRQSEAALQLLTKAVPQKLAAAKRAAHEGAENLQRHNAVDRAASIKETEQSVKSARQSLQYQQEELRQLEKMYKADDLTEDTEEIILTRTRNRVEVYQYMLERTLADRDRFHEIDLPRRQAALQQLQSSTALSLAEAQATLPASLTEKKLAHEKLAIALQRTRQRLEQTRHDREALTVRAPVAGVVYYGQAVRGQWPEATTMGKMLATGSLVKPKQVLMTVVNNDKLLVRASVAEKELHDVRVGEKAAVTPKAFPAIQLSGTLRHVSSIPIAAGKFDAVLDLDGLGNSKRLAAGMACQAVIKAYQQPNAILVPKSAVAADSETEKKHVYLVSADGKQRKRRVRVGRLVGDRFEILSGLKPDDKILRNNAD